MSDNNEEFKEETKEEAKKRAKDTIDTIIDVSVDTYKDVEEKARLLAKKTKLRAGIVNEKATVRRLHVELGTVCYKMFKDNPPPQYVQLFEDITAALERIAEKEAQIEELKAASSKG